MNWCFKSDFHVWEGQHWCITLLNKCVLVSGHTVWETDAHKWVYLTFDATTCSTVTENPGLREMDTAGDREANSEGQQWIVVRWISLALRVNTVALQVNFNQFCSQLCACSLTPLKNIFPPHWPLGKYSIK